MTTWEYYGNTTTMSYDFTKKKKCKIVVTNVKSGEDAAVQEREYGFDDKAMF